MDSGRTAVPDPLPENIANGNRTESMVLENSTVSNPLSEPQLLKCFRSSRWQCRIHQMIHLQY